jgi:hypothetical protein
MNKESIRNMIKNKIFILVILLPFEIEMPVSLNLLILPV